MIIKMNCSTAAVFDNQMRKVDAVAGSRREGEGSSTAQSSWLALGELDKVANEYDAALDRDASSNYESNEAEGIIEFLKEDLQKQRQKYKEMTTKYGAEGVHHQFHQGKPKTVVLGQGRQMTHGSKFGSQVAADRFGSKFKQCQNTSGQRSKPPQNRAFRGMVSGGPVTTQTESSGSLGSPKECKPEIMKSRSVANKIALIAGRKALEQQHTQLERLKLTEEEESKLSESARNKLARDRHNIKERVRRVLITHYLERLASFGFGTQDDKVSVLHAAWRFFVTVHDTQSSVFTELVEDSKRSLPDMRSFNDVAEAELNAPLNFYPGTSHGEETSAEEQEALLAAEQAEIIKVAGEDGQMVDEFCGDESQMPSTIEEIIAEEQN